MIKDIHDVLKTSNEAFIRSMLKRETSPMPTVTEEGREITAEINHGRWIIRCPFCKGAELADKQDKRFFCLSCHNKENGGKYVSVVFPDEEVEIESELAKRGKENQRNWKNPETLEGIKSENKERGL